MTLKGGEYIDAGLKGGMARFMNHSCDPNCLTEPWFVTAAVCVWCLDTPSQRPPAVASTPTSMLYWA